MSVKLSGPVSLILCSNLYLADTVAYLVCILCRLSIINLNGININVMSINILLALSSEMKILTAWPQLKMAASIFGAREISAAGKLTSSSVCLLSVCLASACRGQLSCAALWLAQCGWPQWL
jgi:hypothetical protein